MSPRKRSAPARVARFRVTLDEIAPPVWREFEIDADGTFWDLHVAIQDAFGWKDYHLHRFEAVEPRTKASAEIGIPDVDGFEGDEPVLPGWEVPIAAYLARAGERIDYLYDFGDDWRHVVALEAIEGAAPGTTVPRCTGGERACPPEDCGGPSGYEEFLDALADPNHERHDEMREWAPRGFDPEAFEPRAVVFHDPRRRLRAMLRG